MKRRKKRAMDNCPRCELPHETKQHILTYKATRKFLWRVLMEKFTAWLTEESWPKIFKVQFPNWLTSGEITKILNLQKMILF
mmetsp:Transcript_21001/g.25837  ORF Transcript_21001/g.25837 Transcript_21001/m.25837 type:complete len:82 (-) Transcript_21001:208-453(-)